MRHHNVNRKFGRKRNQRKALLKALAVSLVSSGKIKTTEAKAKELRPFIEKIITRGKNPAKISSLRLISSKIGTLSAKKVVEDISTKYKDRNGGYTRIVKTQNRKGDGSPMAIIEFV